jgi:hypothetical protein
MTDTPVQPQTFPPPSNLDQWTASIGNLARPFAVYAIAASTFWAIVSGKDVGSIAAAGTILGALYAAKTVEVQQQGKQAASVEIAKAASPTATS